MKPFNKKTIHSYIRLLNMFERELKSHHFIFSGDFYYLNYYLKQNSFNNDVKVKIVMVLMQDPNWKEMKKEPDNMKVLLERYSRCFSITDVSIARNYLCFQSPRNKKIEYPTPSPNIEDRVFVEAYPSQEEWFVL
jgi:hypothetical protein